MKYRSVIIVVQPLRLNLFKERIPEGYYTGNGVNIMLLQHRHERIDVRNGLLHRTDGIDEFTTHLVLDMSLIFQDIYDDCVDLGGINVLNDRLHFLRSRNLRTDVDALYLNRRFIRHLFRPDSRLFYGRTFGFLDFYLLLK